MAWPDKLEYINSNLNTTELWILKERMEANNGENWFVFESTGFAEFSKFTIEFLDTGEQFEFEEFVELVSSVKKLWVGEIGLNLRKRY